MKMKFSNKGLLDSLSRNYSIMQNNKINKLLGVASAAVAGGVLVALFMNYFQKKQIDGLVAINKNKRIQNDQLKLENQVLKEKNKVDFLVSKELQNENAITECDAPLFNNSNEKKDNKI